MSTPSRYFQEEPISPILEMGAYEYLWLQPKSSFKKIAELFNTSPHSIPSYFVDQDLANKAATDVLKIINESKIGSFSIRLHGASQYPKTLRDASYPVEMLYYQGTWELSENPKSVAIVGSRKPSDEGLRRTKKLAKQLVQLGYTIVSGLAEGVDTAAHTSAIEHGGKTIAVIGTPITDSYPKQNKALQQMIASQHLLISQVPILRYRQRDWRTNRFFFPERNKTMSALTKATIIVEAGETSGTLIQARAALQQGRKLFILESCFKNMSISWPAKYEKKGAIRVKDIEDIQRGLDGD